MAFLLWHFTIIALRNPSLIRPLLQAAWRFRRREWYRHPPFMPVPSRQYIEWRLHTAYGTERTTPSAPELRRYLRWLRWMNTTRTHGDAHT